MVTLKHAVKISAPRGAVYQALTDLEAMRGWHVGAVEGAIVPGQVMTLTPKPGQRFSWRTDRLEPDVSVVQTEVEGPGSSVGKTEWREGDGHLPFCNTHWGEVLYRLKSHVEKT